MLWAMYCGAGSASIRAVRYQDTATERIPPDFHSFVFPGYRGVSGSALQPSHLLRSWRVAAGAGE